MADQRVAFFLGAGASYPWGIPLIRDMLPMILQKRDRHSPEMQRRLRRRLTEMLPGLRDPRMYQGEGRRFLVTDLLSLIDELLQHGISPVPAWEAKQVEDVRSVLVRMLVGTLREPPAQKKAKRALLAQFVEWILCHARKERNQISIVTTNYDLVLDRALFRALGRSLIPPSVDFGVPWRNPGPEVLYLRPRDAPLALLKLHGSLNWLRCEVCEYIYINPEQRIAVTGEQASRTKWNTCHCGGRLRSLLVAPSLVRDIRDRNLLGIWGTALENLRQADRWVFVGYSLPAEDIAIRTLLMRSFHGHRDKARLHIDVVLHASATEDDLLPYSLLFGRGTNVKHHPIGFEAFIPTLFDRSRSTQRSR